MSDWPLQLVLSGGSGRMGAAIAEVAAERGTAAVTARLGRTPDADPIGGEIEFHAVVVDFSQRDGFRNALRFARARRLAFVSGTTGLGADDLAQLDVAAREIPVLWAANMSVGVAVLRRLAALAAGALGPAFDAEIVELHHRRKADAPSGTALALAAALRSVHPDLRETFGREGIVGARQSDELGVHAVRGGDVVGEHTVFFFGEGERVELTHRATDRRIFARGALRAAHWLSGREPGRYTIDDVLGL